MSSSLLFRLSGLSLLSGMVIAIAAMILHPNSSGVEYLTDPRTVPAHFMALVSVVLMLLGLPGLYARQSERAGILGLVGIVLIFFCMMLLDGTHSVIDSTVRPALASLPEARPLLTEDGPLESAMDGGTLGTIVTVAGPVFLLGLALLGIATIRAAILPRWTAWLLIASIPLLPISFMTPLPEDVAFTMPYIALGSMGFALFTGHGVKARIDINEPTRKTSEGGLSSASPVVQGETVSE